jgi:hypothetical protein
MVLRATAMAAATRALFSRGHIGAHTFATRFPHDGIEQKWSYGLTTDAGGFGLG